MRLAFCLSRRDFLRQGTYSGNTRADVSSSTLCMRCSPWAVETGRWLQLGSAVQHAFGASFHLRGKRIETGFRDQVELVWENLRLGGVRLYRGTV